MAARASKTMIVNVDQIRESGYTLDEPLSVPTLDAALAEGTGFSAAGPSKLHATLHKVSGGVLLRGDFELQLKSACKRCLLETRSSLPVSFTLNLVPEVKVKGEQGEPDDDARSERAGSFALDDADQETFDGKQIDLDPIVREQILLALPMDSLCKEDCKGLCAQCGTNLNETKCGCDPKPLDPRLAALKNIKLKPQA